MEDKKVLKEKELENVSGGTTLSDMPQRDERQGWISSIKNTKTKGEIIMEDKKLLNENELKKVSGGAGNITTSRIHTDCGGNVILEDFGTYFEDIYLTCQKCGKTWHPHSYDKLNECDGIFTFTSGSF